MLGDQDVSEVRVPIRRRRMKRAEFYEAFPNIPRTSRAGRQRVAITGRRYIRMRRSFGLGGEDQAAQDSVLGISGGGPRG